VRVTRRTIGSFVKATGVVKPRIGAEVKVGSRVSGAVARLHVRIGDRVARGQLLAELETRELLARRDQAQAALAAAEATLQYARADLGRKQALRASELVSAADLDVAERTRGVAEQQQAEAAANLDFARTQVGYARIAAPIAGIVASVSTQEGETVAASLAAPTFVTLVDLARLEVWAYVDETDIGRVETGQAARFTVDTYGDAGNGWNAPATDPKLLESIQRASTSYFGKPAMFAGLGGSIPFMSMLGERFPQAQFLITGAMGPGSNAHGPNEFLHLPTGARVTSCVAQVIADHTGRAK